MSMTFPTGIRDTPPGKPRHANPCQCSRPLIDPHTRQCVRCGKYDKATISLTWQQRALEIAMRAHR